MAESANAVGYGKESELFVRCSVRKIRYERTQLAKVLKMNELVLRAKIQRIALPMYQAAVDRY